MTHLMGPDSIHPSIIETSCEVKDHGISGANSTVSEGKPAVSGDTASNSFVSVLTVLLSGINM